MSDRSVPNPMPPALRDSTNMRLGDRDLSTLDNDGRFVIRRMISAAYALGFADGQFDQDSNQRADEQVEREKEGTA